MPLLLDWPADTALTFSNVIIRPTIDISLQYNGVNATYNIPNRMWATGVVPVINFQETKNTVLQSSPLPESMKAENPQPIIDEQLLQRGYRARRNNENVSPELKWRKGAQGKWTHE